MGGGGEGGDHTARLNHEEVILLKLEVELHYAEYVSG